MAGSSPGKQGVATPDWLKKSSNAVSPGTGDKADALLQQLHKLKAAGNDESLDQTIAAVQAELNTMRGENDELRGYAEQAVEQAVRLKQENEELLKEKEDAVLERQLSKKSSETERLAEASSAYKRNLLQQNLARKENEMQQANDRLQAAERQIKGLSAQLSELRKAHREATSELEDLKERQAVSSKEAAMAHPAGPKAAEASSAGTVTEDKANEHEQLAVRLLEAGPDKMDSATLAAVAAGLRDTGVLEKQLKRARDENERLKKEIQGLNETVFSKSFKAPSAWAEREVKYKMEKRAWEVEVSQLKEQIRGLSEENKGYREDNKAAEFETQIQELKQAVKQAQNERTEAQKALHELQLEMREAAVRHSATGHREMDPEADNVHSIINSMEHNHIGVQQPQQAAKAQKVKASNARAASGPVMRSGSEELSSFPVGAANLQEIIDDYDDQGIGIRGPGGRRKSMRQRPAHFSGIADAASGDLSDETLSVDLESIKGELQAESRGGRRQRGENEKRGPRPSPLGARYSSQEWETGSEAESLNSERPRNASSVALDALASSSQPHADAPLQERPAPSRLGTVPGSSGRQPGAALESTGSPAADATNRDRGLQGADTSRADQPVSDLPDSTSDLQAGSRPGQVEVSQDAALLGQSAAQAAQNGQGEPQAGRTSGEPGGVAGGSGNGAHSGVGGVPGSGGPLSGAEGLQEGMPYASFSSWEHRRDALLRKESLPSSSERGQDFRFSAAHEAGGLRGERHTGGVAVGEGEQTAGEEEPQPGSSEGGVAAAVAARGEDPSLPAVHAVSRDWNTADQTRDPLQPLEAVDEPALTSVSSAIINERYVPMVDPPTNQSLSEQLQQAGSSSAPEPLDAGGNEGSAAEAAADLHDGGHLGPSLSQSSSRSGSPPPGAGSSSAVRHDLQVSGSHLLAPTHPGGLAAIEEVVVGEVPSSGRENADPGLPSSSRRLIGPESGARPRGLAAGRPPVASGNVGEIEALGDDEAEALPPRTERTSSADDLRGTPDPPAVYESRSTLKDVNGRYISRASSDDDSPWTEEKRMALQADKEAVEAEWQEHVADQDVGALRYRAAELESRVEMHEAQILKMQRALERADQEKARLEQELASAVLSPSSTPSTSLEHKGTSSMRARMRRVVTLSQQPPSKQKLETLRALQEAYRETQLLQRQRDELHRQLSAIATKLNAGLIPDPEDLALPLQEEDLPEEGSGAEGTAEGGQEAAASAEPSSNPADSSEAQIRLNVSMATDAARKRKVAAFIGGLTDEEVEVMTMREENAAMMETLVRTKVELAETQGDYLKMRRALIRAVEKQAALADKLESVKSAFGDGDMASVEDLIKGAVSPRNIGGDIESLGERQLY